MVGALPRGDMCTCHVAICVHAMWLGITMWRCVYTPRGDECVRMCVQTWARASVCLCVCVIYGLTYFSRYELSPFIRTRYIPLKLPLFMSCGTIFLFISSQVTWRNEKCLIHALNWSRRSSLKWGGMRRTLIGRRFIWKWFNLKCSYEEIKCARWTLVDAWQHL